MIKLRVLNCFAVFDWWHSLVSLIEEINKYIFIVANDISNWKRVISLINDSDDGDQIKWYWRKKETKLQRSEIYQS